ncbi:CubicO group peptidase, beta-lactamase class C family [Filimonas lacunae]|uniref:CubicO group peptidase, beta-lactamase class C family n=1 Tax=Filimonas lacunae TaxID=477680 RepID=A0A173MAV8_9BACT|nr:serine hydrolase domain-containing protein [Filimonas lacunae]BAV04621.1 beta-lactamase class C and other penicillin binding proteins [Filimonas lacunae]SIT32620.1 CubicO group peptidase, beta-lactamase class C family [Filimonas lacunae]
MRNVFYLLSAMALTAAATVNAQEVLHPAAPAAAHVSAERLQRIDKTIQQYIDSNWLKGAIALIARDGNIVYNKAFGTGGAEGNATMQKDNIFRIASQTKAITSVAVMMLFEEGKLLLDDPISKYIPSFAKPQVLDQFNEADSSYTTTPAKREITIRDLLTHTSGIGYAGIGAKKTKAIYAKASIPSGIGSDTFHLATAITRLGTLPLEHNPGEKFTYGLNTDVLGYLVEVVSGMSLDQFFKTRIFEPLGMKDTYFYLPQEKQNRLVALYTIDKDTKKLVPYQEKPGIAFSVDYAKRKGTYYSGGAGLVSTVQDYAIFLQALLNGGIYNGKRILSPRTVELMIMNQVGDIQVGLNKFGLGFEITTEKGMAKLGASTGTFSWGGYFGTIYWADPQKHLVGLLFINQSPLTHGEIQDKFKALVYQSLD